MIKKNYYKILGIEQDANSDEIRKAYRQKARDKHPDSGKCEDSAEFRDVQEAYETLRNQGARDQYDRELRGERNPYRSFNHYRHSPNYHFFGIDDWIFSGIRTLEIILTLREARTGVELGLTIPVNDICPVCHGGSDPFFFPCLECGGRGVIAGQQTIRFQIPPGVTDNSSFYLQTNNGEKIARIIVVIE
ncbi:DnaJ domain-containing protein [candidate division KSB1 bacterium]|nr:DnaJ domain-containing protein [candidate division KSB1 bacterium]